MLDGGAGNDFLSGLGGADVYLFGPGSGRDIVGGFKFQVQRMIDDAIA